MIHFTDGPAANVTLTLQRAPILLRVVRPLDGDWDALDQLDDVAKPGESIHLYRLVGTSGFCFLDYRDKSGRRRGSSSATGEYRYDTTGPDEATMRDNAAWVAWCDANKARVLAEREAELSGASPAPSPGEEAGRD